MWFLYVVGYLVLAGLWGGAALGLGWMDFKENDFDDTAALTAVAIFWPLTAPLVLVYQGARALERAVRKKE
jgi:hypothetical protein